MSKPSSASYLPRKEWEILCTPRIQHYLGDSLSYMKKAVRINVDLKVPSLIANCLSELSIIMCVLHVPGKRLKRSISISAAPFTLFFPENQQALIRLREEHLENARFEEPCFAAVSFPECHKRQCSNNGLSQLLYKASIGNKGEFFFISTEANIITGSLLVTIFVLVTLISPLESHF